jgi:hypothetical protein
MHRSLSTARPDPSTSRSGPQRALAPEYYSGAGARAAEVFERERRAIFARQWLVVGREDQLKAAGDYVSLTIAGAALLCTPQLEHLVIFMFGCGGSGYPLFIIRGKEAGAGGAAVYHGYYNVCPHRAGPLVPMHPNGGCAPAPPPSHHPALVCVC